MSRCSLDTQSCTTTCSYQPDPQPYWSNHPNGSGFLIASLRQLSSCFQFASFQVGPLPADLCNESTETHYCSTHCSPGPYCRPYPWQCFPSSGTWNQD